MLALMLLVRPGYSESRRSGKARRSWTAVQQEELQLQALAALATVAPLMLDEYMACQANTCLLMLLDWCTQQGSDSHWENHPAEADNIDKSLNITTYSVFSVLNAQS